MISFRCVWVVSVRSFLPGSFRPILGASQFSIGRWVVSAFFFYYYYIFFWGGVWGSFRPKPTGTQSMTDILYKGNIEATQK